ncbi:MAG TPA: HTH-type transcriptional repressor FabR [Leptospiraceae bacterium]|nr:HTH-type transcriptional repressor FabR [Leptospiraceae bacterium]HMX30629.1 HTH-type transcriptional repressor FabR [Leptospiraceae bacterium]HMY31329.1 HTH-type transcriptional repressor FabR [Leptospiraceae bacterium]HMZ63442.1 HTH-type transcriptional repressor FabR [Leptospiraceae bacterium]HNA08418.1 HTH-type transcriptional repressor FabR [Leptospiraceae bacterium]
MFTNIYILFPSSSQKKLFFSERAKKVKEQMKLNQRYQQKLRTRTTLIQAALKLMGEDKSLGSLSLREIAGEAGIVPAAFYRHFKDIEELGLALVDDMSVKLRVILRDARKKGAYKTALQVSIELFFNYVKNNRLLFRFITRERVGGSRRIREAIRNEMSFIASELASDMKRPGMPFSKLEFISDFIVTTAFTLAGDYLDSDPNDQATGKKLKVKSIKQLRLIFRGSLITKRRIKKRINPEQVNENDLR